MNGEFSSKLGKGKNEIQLIKRENRFKSQQKVRENVKNSLSKIILAEKWKNYSKNVKADKLLSMLFKLKSVF